MKTGRVALLASLLALASGVHVRSTDRTITQVVKLLQGMLDTSKTEAEEERELYAKYKCYCDTNEVEKTTSIEDLTKEVGLLENEITAIQGESGVLSMESAKLQAEMTANEEERNAADALRTKAKEDFEATETDLKAAIAQMGLAIDTLSAIGADQSLQASAEHDKFMAQYNGKGSLVHLQATVKKALVDAEAFLSPSQRTKFASFIQAPFSATYTAQSGGIVGILKSMKETFESNLESAQATEKAQVEAHTAFMDTAQSAYDTMEEALNTKQDVLSGNDGTLSTKKGALSAAETQLSDDQDFLEQLKDMCKEKAEEFEKRKMFRSNEEAAISKAIAILNSDKAFAAFGKVDATSTGATSLVQIRAHSQGAAAREEIVSFLRHVAATQKSAKVAKIASLVTKMNPFTVVLNEIDKMKQLIADEAAADQKQLTWCTDERSTNRANRDTKTNEITTLEGRIDELMTDIDDPEVGLKKQIADKEQSLEDNYKQQQDETAVRREENKVYQGNVANIQEASTLLQQAIIVLEKYYDALEMQLKAEAAGFIQQPSPPPTWDGDFSGQKSEGGSAIDMLKFILGESEKEESTAHTNEQDAQHAYEDSMGTLKTDESDLQGELVTLQKSLADAEEELITKKEELATTVKDKAAIEKYLKQIKPGCDFIEENFDTREAHRSTELTALETAATKIKATPAFAKAAAEDQNKDWGVCADTCGANEAHADCQACLAKVTVAGYCAGHPETPGC